jgi:hypothetical protein
MNSFKFFLCHYLILAFFVLHGDRSTLRANEQRPVPYLKAVGAGFHSATDTALKYAAIAM